MNNNETPDLAVVSGYPTQPPVLSNPSDKSRCRSKPGLPTARFWLMTSALILFFFNLVFPLTLDASASTPDLEEKKARIDAEKAECLRCHGMKTIGYQDPKTGALVNLHIDQEAFKKATHGKQACTTCHKGDFTEYPHEIAHEKQAASCPDCHQDNPKLARYRFDKVAVQFKKSVHYQKDPKGFNCYTCHEQHSWQLGGSTDRTQDLVGRNNQTCLNCHEKQARAKQEDSTDPGLAIHTPHRWLPSTGLHMKKVRCVACHTPRPGSIIHAIEPARRAEKNCESCHSKDSILLTKLYKYRLQENERNAGFINGVVLNDTYIIGMTRHPLLDLLGILAIAFTTIGVLAHGLGRWIAARRRKKNGDH
ncbi:MAG: hypothetical protein HQL67_06955 [Magnetococcales bacterium]|nr:hypothetical protein [Magnetococcales bacterium]